MMTNVPCILAHCPFCLISKIHLSSCSQKLHMHQLLAVVNLVVLFFVVDVFHAQLYFGACQLGSASVTHFLEIFHVGLLNCLD